MNEQRVEGFEMNTHVPAEIDDPVLLVRITKTYRPNLTADELYDATRGSWVLGARRESVEYVLSVHDGVVQEVYRVDRWAPGGSTEYLTDVHSGPHSPDRWEFEGEVARTEIRHKYWNKSVKQYLSPSNQNPIRYVNC